MKHMLIAQSGGPSAAINATVAGVVERCMTSSKVDRIYGAVNGIKGVISGHYVDLTDVLASPEQLDLSATHHRQHWAPAVSSSTTQMNLS